MAQGTGLPLVNLQARIAVLVQTPVTKQANG